MAASSLLAACGFGKSRGELLQDVINAQQALTVAEKNSSDPAGLSKAQATYDAAYLAYDPGFPKSHSGK
jgi:hypothetical protein